MKICMLSTGHGPLDDRIYYKEALSLAKNYAPIQIITAVDEPGLEDNSNARFLSLKKSGSLVNRIMSIPAAVYSIVRQKPDVCHFHDYELIFAVPFIRLLSQCRIIYDVHEVYPEMVLQSHKIHPYLKPFLAFAVDVAEKCLARLTDHIVVSDNNIARRFYSLKERVSIIFNYPDMAMFCPDENRVEELRTVYDGMTPIVYQGGISEERGLFLMVEAMEEVVRFRGDIILLIVGNMSDDLKVSVKNIIGEKGLDINIHVTGWVPHEDVVNYIAVSKLGLVPFLPTEKFKKNIPIKQFEYMACGVPVLGADLPPISTYVDEAGSGRVFPPGNSYALARNIIDMLEDEQEWQRMSDAGRKAIKSKWNWPKMEEELLSIYEKLETP